MRKLLMLAVLAVPLILITPSPSMASHCHFCCHHHGCGPWFGPCHSHCWTGCFGFAPFCGVGCRSYVYPSYGYATSFYLPAYFYNNAPYSYSLSPTYPANVTPTYYPSLIDNPTSSGVESLLARAAARPAALARTATTRPAPTAAHARVVIQLPADAKLTANGVPLKTTSDRRVFATPDLEPGKSFRYTFTAEVVRGGQPVSSTKNVLVRAGEESQVTFELPGALAVR
jgi:uncharacterized protein (TIGR03000 family)